MLAQHRDAFFEVATTHHCWIGLRDPNALADPWIGRQGCYPKPITCKAKTADVPGKPFSGLVVSPWILDDHFSMSRLDKARRSWEQFQGLLKESDDPDPSFQAIRRVQTLTTASAPSRTDSRLMLCGTDSTKYDYLLIVDGPRRGVVLYRGMQIFADYDLFAIVGVDGEGRMTAQWSESRHAEKYREVMSALNTKFQFSIDMVQHAADFDWKKGTATSVGDSVLWFGPRREETYNPSTAGQFSVTQIQQSYTSGLNRNQRDDLH